MHCFQFGPVDDGLQATRINVDAILANDLTAECNLLVQEAALANCQCETSINGSIEENSQPCEVCTKVLMASSDVIHPKVTIWIKQIAKSCGYEPIIQ